MARSVTPGRTRTAVATLILVLSGGAVLGACGGQSADALAHKACLEVQRSINLYDQSQREANPATRAELASKALSVLRLALQPAAMAGGGGGQWEALEITLSESNRVAEATLIPALTAQCALPLQSN